MKKIYMCVFFITIVIVCASCNSEKKEKNEFETIGENEWALYNYGQIVKGIQGTEGVDINITKVWEIIDSSSTVAVGLVDTGVEIIEKDNKKLWVNQYEIPDNGLDDDENGYVDDVYGWDFYNQDSSIYDDYLYDYHGTYIANMIGRIVPNSKIISSKFLKGTQGDTFDAIEAIEYAIENGAEIINCSWCFEKAEERLFSLIENNPDVLFVCAAGNSDINLDEIHVYPASYSLNNLISVMAIDNKGEKYALSGYGLSVDIGAPGKDIEVLLPEGDTTYVSGTSIATAFVTGAAALMKSYNQELTPYEIKTILIESAHKMECLSGICKAGGFLDVYNAVMNCESGDE